jgi:hypothetical protein
VKCGGGANFNTRRIGTMVASMNGKFSGGIGEGSFFNIFHMGAVHTNGHIVFAFASDRAGMTSNAHSVINDKSVIQFIRSK